MQVAHDITLRACIIADTTKIAWIKINAVFYLGATYAEKSIHH